MGTRGARGHLAPASAERFCRGRQIADAVGLVEFVTIFPGWYAVRTPHIHLKAYVGERTLSSEALAKEDAAKSQLFFTDEMTREIYASAPYAPRGLPETTNANDFVLRQANGATGSWPKVARGADALGASLTIGVGR